MLPPWLSGHKFDCRPFSGNLKSLPTCSWPSRLLNERSQLHELVLLGCHCANFVILFSHQEGFLQLLLEMIILMYYQFPQLPACSLYQPWTSSWCYGFHSDTSSLSQLGQVLIYLTVQMHSPIFHVCLKLCSLPNLLYFPLAENFTLNDHSIPLLCWSPDPGLSLPWTSPFSCPRPSTSQLLSAMMACSRWTASMSQHAFASVASVFLEK